MEKIKYITNKELLVEIDRSKRSYCSFIDPKYASYDVIVNDVKDITSEFAEQVLLKKNTKSKRGVIVETIPAVIDDLVFRVMTQDHVPLSDDKKKRSRSVAGAGHLRTNFPPFKHYILRDGEPMEVGRSHWKDGLQNGEFSLDHGKITDRLAMMFMLLVERYGRRGNFRSYCTDELTEALTQRGWLKHNEITEDDIILSYEAGQLKWSKIKSIYRGDYEGKMFKLDVVGLDALVTPHHKFVTDSGLKEVEHLCEKDRLILMGDAVDAPEPTYSDEFVEMAGWTITEGSFDKSSGPRGHRHFQNQKVLSMPFILSLSQHQKELLINTMVDGDRWRSKRKNITHVVYAQKCSKKHADAFLALCTLAGYRASCREKNIVSFGKPTKIYVINISFGKRRYYSQVENIDFHGAKRNSLGARGGHGKIYHPNEPTIDYKGKVWCPETEFGSFVARRNGYIYISGNSYLDELKCSALLQLSQVGLLFDESKAEEGSRNPFAFYTTVCRNAFVRVLNIEKKNQDIRDDLLIIGGAAPSYTRQLDNELSQKDPDTAPTNTVSSKRGRKLGPNIAPTME